MPMRYLLSCFWEGQEGSFLLWTFWNLILGNVLIKTAGKWQPSTMTVVSSVQVFLASKLLGVYIFGYKLGSNPFILLREHPDMVNLPFTKISDYVLRIDGRGLNPILQNYWMIIHPPTLFLGFSATLIPFAYSIAGFWKKEFGSWQKPALPWTFFAVLTLGTGVLMGGAWAYEALSFGGFWAWDPVENASLVPWITLVGAAHVMLITKANGKSIKSSFILTTATFILILYSSFLTRSGILGDASVHAFTDLGMSGQLLVYLATYVLLSAFLLLGNLKKIPNQEGEDSVLSREFWLLVGALVLFISAFQISFSTSIPVINKIFGTELAPPADVISHYHSWQIPFAAIIALMIAVGQFFKYKHTPLNEVLKKLALAGTLTILVTGILTWYFSMFNAFYTFLMAASVFAILSNLDYLFRILKGKVKKGGASIAHVGFGLILLGALISMGNSVVISTNTSGVNIERLGKDFSNRENIMLPLGDTLKMGGYWVTYTGKRKEGINIYFDIQYLSRSKDNSYQHEFSLSPRVQLNETMGNVAEPDTRHFWNRDIYTHITYADLTSLSKFSDNEGDYNPAQDNLLSMGDSLFTSNAIIILDHINPNLDKDSFNLSEDDIIIEAQLKALDKNGDTSYANPIYLIQSNQGYTIQDSIPSLGLKFEFNKVVPMSGKVNISVSEKKGNKKEFIIMKALVFPFINLLWTGAILLILGCALAIANRINTQNK